MIFEFFLYPKGFFIAIENVSGDTLFGEIMVQLSKDHLPGNDGLEPLSHEDFIFLCERDGRRVWQGRRSGDDFRAHLSCPVRELFPIGDTVVLLGLLQADPAKSDVDEFCKRIPAPSASPDQRRLARASRRLLEILKRSEERWYAAHHNVFFRPFRVYLAMIEGMEDETNSVGPSTVEALKRHNDSCMEVHQKFSEFLGGLRQAGGEVALVTRDWFLRFLQICKCLEQRRRRHLREVPRLMLAIIQAVRATGHQGVIEVDACATRARSILVEARERYNQVMREAKARLSAAVRERLEIEQQLDAEALRHDGRERRRCRESAEELRRNRERAVAMSVKLLLGLPAELPDHVAWWEAPAGAGGTLSEFVEVERLRRELEEIREEKQGLVEEVEAAKAAAARPYPDLVRLQAEVEKLRKEKKEDADKHQAEVEKLRKEMEEEVRKKKEEVVEEHKELIEQLCNEEQEHKKVVENILKEKKEVEETVATAARKVVEHREKSMQLQAKVAALMAEVVDLTAKVEALKRPATSDE